MRGADDDGIESWRRTTMTARKKTAKRTANRGSKSQRGAAKSAKNSAARKSKASKTLTKLEKAALAARKKAANAKAAAKSASRPAAPSSKAKTAAKRAAAASKSARAPVKNRADVAAKGVAGIDPAETSAAAVHIKENEALSAVKTKTEAKSSSAAKTPLPVKKPMSAKIEGAAPVKAVAPLDAPRESGSTAEQARKAPVAAPVVAAPVVALQGAVKAPRPPEAIKSPVQSGEEPAAQKNAKSAAPRHGFKTHEFVVYPAHGVGQIVAIEEQEVAGFRLELFVITFVKDKMMLRVPVGKSASVGMRKLSEPDLVKRALDTLLGRARIKRTMWSRRAQEYEAKINSGDLIAIAEVVRDLYRSEAQPEQSYSERQLYEAALDRMAREVAVVQKLGETEALKAIEGQLQKGQRRGKTDSAAVDEAAGEADVEEAA